MGRVRDSLWNQSIRISDELTRFTNLCSEVKRMHTYCEDRLKECDKETQDYLHKLELESLTSSEKAKIATALKRVRKERRYYKDRVESCQPLIEAIETNPCKIFINNLSGVVSKCKRVESYHTSRTYIPKVVKETWIEVKDPE